MITEINFATFSATVESCKDNPVRLIPYLDIFMKKVSDDSIELYTECLISPSLYKTRESVCLKLRKPNVTHAQVNYSKLRYHLHFTDHIRADFAEGVEIVEGWKRVIIHRSGIITVLETNDFSKVFATPIEEAYPLVKAWECRLKDFTQKEKFIPNLTPGVDTRILFNFWKDRKDIKRYLHRARKNNAVYAIELGKQAVDLVRDLCDLEGRSDLIRLENEDLTEADLKLPFLSGAYTEHGQRIEQFNNERFLTCIVNRCAFNSIYSNCMPYLDDNYLKIRQDELLQLRCIFTLLFVPEAQRKIPFISEKAQYTFEKDFPELTKRCEGVISEWIKRG